MHAQTILIGGFASDLYDGNTMIDMYVKCGFLDCGHKVFDEMGERDVVSLAHLCPSLIRRRLPPKSWVG
jgi:pentatricopeptide repeat protein